MSNTYRYYFKQSGQDRDDAYSFSTDFNDRSLRYVAEDAAEDYHSNHDGWESSWHLRFTIVDSQGIDHDFEVSREAVPRFYAEEEKNA